MRAWRSLVLVALGATLLHAEDRKLDELEKLRAETAARRSAALDLARRGTEAIDADSEQAAALLAEAAAATSALAPLDRRARALIAAIVTESLAALDADSYAAREEATARLSALDRRAVLPLEAARATLGAEGRHRLAQILAAVKGRDEDGVLHQWAVNARASSEYSDTDWSALQATGEPDTFRDGDIVTAWASHEPDAGIEWLELDYATEVRPSLVRVRETFNPGAVVKVEAMKRDGTWVALWEGSDPTRDSPGWFEVPVSADLATRRLRVTLDTRLVRGWNEIDAVELLGRSARDR